MTAAEKGKEPILIVIDIETDGPTPLRNSMLSLASVAIDVEKNAIGSFVRNLAALPGAVRDESFAATIASEGDVALAAVTVDPSNPAAAIGEWLSWLDDVRSGREISLAFRDLRKTLPWIVAYAARFSGRTPDGLSSAICMKELSKKLRGHPAERTTPAGTDRLPKRWFSGGPEKNRFILTDAVSHANMLVNMLREERGLRPIGTCRFQNESVRASTVRGARIKNRGSFPGCRRSSTADPFELVHERTIRMRGARANDGTWMISGRLIDEKHHEIESACKGRLAPGARIHDISVAIETKDDFVIRSIDVSFAEHPYPVCPDVAQAFSSLAGLSLSSGFAKEVRTRFSGKAGCLHVVELLPLLSATAFQSIIPWLGKDGAAFKTKPPMPDACHALDLDGDFVAATWPEHSRRTDK
jgi:hypothetical protein